MSQKPGYSFTLRDVKVEDVPEQKLFCVRFCERYPELWSHFVAVGSTTVSLYRIDTERVVLLRHYVDEDCRTVKEKGDNGAERSRLDAENYYACVWGSTSPGHPCIAVAGIRGIIKVISLDLHVVGALVGHGGEVMELKTLNKDDGLLLSASSDFSIRLWNLRTLSCVAIFGGDQGHRREVLSIDVHALDNCFVSSSMDTSIKIWNLEDPDIVAAIQKSELVRPEQPAFRSIIQQLPLFSTTQIHTGYVDSVCWVGDCVLSKSTNNRIVLWAPDAARYKGATTILQEYVLKNGEVWFTKMDKCIPLSLFAVGNAKGKIYLYPLGPDIPESLLTPSQMDSAAASTTERYQFPQCCTHLSSLQHPKPSIVVRQVSFSTHARYLVACADDGSVLTWEITQR